MTSTCSAPARSSSSASCCSRPEPSCTPCWRRPRWASARSSARSASTRSSACCSPSSTRRSTGSSRPLLRIGSHPRERRLPLLQLHDAHHHRLREPGAGWPARQDVRGPGDADGTDLPGHPGRRPGQPLASEGAFALRRRLRLTLGAREHVLEQRRAVARTEPLDQLRLDRGRVLAVDRQLHCHQSFGGVVTVLGRCGGLVGLIGRW